MTHLLALAAIGHLCAASFAFIPPPAHHSHPPQNSQSTLPVANARTCKTKTALLTSISTTVVTSSINGDGDDNDENGHATSAESEPLSGPSISAQELSQIEHIIDASDDRLFTLPRHSTNDDVNEILAKTERALRGLHAHSLEIQDRLEIEEIEAEEEAAMRQTGETGEISADTSILPTAEEEPVVDYGNDRVFSNTYVDLGKVDTVGFDYDYTLVTYKEELLHLIYEKALKRLVEDKYYPVELLHDGLKFDPRFSIRGLAVDKETGWICHLSYTHKVACAWEGRNKVSRARLMEEYSGKRSLTPDERKKRLKPLNDLFSMAECCLIADVVQFFLDRGIPFCPRNAVHDILSSIGSTHISGEFHRMVAADPGRYFEEQPHLKEVISSLKESGKRLIFASNSPFWYVDAGMKHVMGDDWREDWDVVIVSAGKPRFYTEEARPFREVSSVTGRVKFKKIDVLEKGEVYTEGCLRELIRCTNWNLSTDDRTPTTDDAARLGADGLATPKVLYIGDSLFADLVDAKRQYGWTTAAVTPEVGHEIEKMSRTQFILTQRSIDLLLNLLRNIQVKLGNGLRDEADMRVLDSIEGIVSKWRDQQTLLLGNPFGSVFRARYQPSLFAHSLRRYCDLYMSSVSSLRHYSPQHRFYPSDARLLSHEIGGSNAECWNLEDVLSASDDDLSLL